MYTVFRCVYSIFFTWAFIFTINARNQYLIVHVRFKSRNGSILYKVKVSYTLPIMNPYCIMHYLFVRTKCSQLYQSLSGYKLHRNIGWVRKNVGRLTDFDIALNHLIVVKCIFPCSHESNLDHKPFPVQIGHLMHFYKKIFFVRPCMGVLQTGGIFAKPFPYFIQANVTGTHGIIRGGWNH